MGGWLSSTEAEPQFQYEGGLSDNDQPMMEEPWCLRPHELEKWYKDNIQLGTGDFDINCRIVVDQVVRWLHQNCASSDELFDLSEIIKGGSLGKGTMVKDKSDVDLVAFINPPHLDPIGSSPQRYRSELQDVISDLKTTVSRLRNVRNIRSDSYLVNFELTVGSRCIEVDLLPTANNIHGRSLGEVFEEMLGFKSSYDMGYYSASLVKYQRDFVRDQPGYVKELIRLVKYWAYTNLPKPLQKSYPLELITIYCWEKAGSPQRLNMSRGLKDVLLVLTNLSTLRHYWEENYDSILAERSIQQLRHKEPIMLDPANPTNNACWVYQRGNNMEVIAEAATATLASPVLRDVTVYSNWIG